MRLGFFGGSFDPPHLGHLAVARTAAAAFSLDRVLLAPTGQQPLKPDGALASFNDRLAMVRLLCTQNSNASNDSNDSNHPSFTASDIEAPHPDHTPNYTIDTLTRLRGTLAPTDEIFVLVGVDAFLDLKRWREPNQLLTLAQWIVLSRPGILFSLSNFLDNDLAPLQLTAAQRARVHHLDTLAEPASATHIRALLRSLTASEPELSPLLPPAVLAYIRAHHLYGT
jgi:nicotinate-nucleotide adenylyltransferase